MGKIEQYLAQSPKLRPAVVGYLLRNDYVLLGLRETSSLELGLDLIAGLGGGQELGETFEEAFKREVEEEAEIKEIDVCIDMGRVIFLFPHKPKWNHDVRVYLVEEGQWRGDPNETESTRPAWFPKNNLPLSRMWPDNAFWVPEVLAGNQVNGIFLYDEHGKVIEHQLEVLKSNS